MIQIADNLAGIHEKIATSAAESGRDAANVTLVAVSKVQPPEKLRAALNAGQRVFGENRVQEAYEHWRDIRQGGQFPDLKLHLIGPLQTNKVKEAVALFDVIESVDRPKLARALAAEMEKQKRSLPCFIQVNTGEEPQKAGVIPAELPEFYKFCTQECDLNIIGLMCIPPVEEPPAMHFAFLHKLATELGLKELSMGMSGDFEKAVALGATFVRVGTGVFGERETA